MAIAIGGNLKQKYQGHKLESIDKFPKEWIELYQEWEIAFQNEHGDYPLGEPFPLELFPKSARFTEGKKMFDWHGVRQGGGTVSKRLKDAIEDIEPGVHQFVPVEIFFQDGTPYGEPFWFFQICTCIDVINPVLGGVKKNFYTAYPEEKPDAYRWGIARGRLFDGLAVYKDKIKGRAVWRDKRYQTGRFFSDVLVKRMEEEGIEGWDAITTWQEL